jgi:dihydrofolate synthase/folylpolyglutamate synthase
LGGLKSIDEWLSYQESLHTKEIDLGLDRIKQVYKKLFPKKHTFKIITVAGTNGKGSTLAFLENIYQQNYQTGQFSSPHIFRYNERIRVNGKESSDEIICWAFEKIEQVRKDISLTYFEFSILAALLIFQQQKVDIALLEVGLGGRLDAVNVVDSDCSVITNIDIDHIEYLGNTREKIAIEKMGIMRPSKPCLSADNNPPVSMLNKNIIFVKQKYQGELSLQGEHQKVNAQLAIEVIKQMDLKVAKKEIGLGLKSVQLFGRQQIIKYQNKLFLFDVAHNLASVEELAKTLQKLEGQTVAIFSALKDKNIEAMIEVIRPNIKKWFLIPLSSNRAIEPDKLQTFFKSQVVICDNANQAVITALQTNAFNVVVFGSFITVADVFNAMKILK